MLIYKIKKQNIPNVVGDVEKTALTLKGNTCS